MIQTLRKIGAVMALLVTLGMMQQAFAQCQAIPSIASPSCTQSISGGSVNLNNATDVVCITANSNIGTANFNAAGTLIIESGATVSGGINANNGGTIIVRGTFNWNGASNLGGNFSIQVAAGGQLNRSGDITFNSGQHQLNNAGTVNISSNLTFLGTAYNSGTIVANGFNLNSTNTKLINTGSITVAAFFNVNTLARVENCGSIDVGVNLEVNGGASFYNYCTLVVHDFTQQLSVLENHCLFISGTSGSGDGFLHQGSVTRLFPGSVLVTKDFFWSSNGPIELMGNAKVVVAEAVLGTGNTITALNAPGRLRVAGGASLIGSGTLTVCDIDPVSAGDNPTGVAFPSAVAALVNTGSGTTLNLRQANAGDIPAGACCSVSVPCTGFAVSLTAVPANCAGAANGSATASASGGTAPYSYTWSTGASTSTVSGLVAGTYSVTVTGADSCTEVASIVVGEPAALALSTSSVNATCGQSNGAATAIATGGTSPYTYTWSTGANTSSVSGLAAGSYTVTVADGNGCSATAGVTVSVANGPQVSATATDATCGQSNGAVTAIATGGTTPYTYTWSTGANTSSVSGLAAGSYTVTVADGNGCSATAGVTVSVANGPQVSATATDASCGQSDGTATAAASGGTTPYTYSWSTGASSVSISGLSAGSYGVTVTDANGCVASANVVVSETVSQDSCTIAPGEFRTQTQGGWGSRPNGNNPGVYLHTHFAAAFPAGLTVGCTHTVTFTAAQSITDYLPCGGPSAILTSSYTDPSCLGNVVLSQLIAATISVTFDRYDVGFGASSTALGDLVIASGNLAGLTVDQVLAEANNAVGGCGSSYSLSDLNTALTAINENFVDGTIAGNGLLCPNPCGAPAPPLTPSASLRAGAWPNPSVDQVNIELELANEGEVSVMIYDAQGGGIIRQLPQGNLSAGIHQITWDGANDHGVVVLPGLYLVRIIQGEEIAYAKVLRLNP